MSEIGRIPEAADWEANAFHGRCLALTLPSAGTGCGSGSGPAGSSRSSRNYRTAADLPALGARLRYARRAS